MLLVLIFQVTCLIFLEILKKLNLLTTEMFQMECINASYTDMLGTKDGTYFTVSHEFIRSLNKTMTASGNSNVQNINISKTSL
jgi:hypothetical protein